MRASKRKSLNKSGNGSRIRSIEFDLADAPVIAHALMIAANVAMMGQTEDSEARLRFYRDQFLAVAPPGHKHLKSEEHLCDIAIQMDQSPTWSIHRMNERWSEKGYSIITVGEHAWETYNLTMDEHEALSNCIASIAPLSCEKVEREDEKQKRY